MKRTAVQAARVVIVVTVQLLAGWFWLSARPAATPVARPCPEGFAVVSGAGAQDFADICQGVASALSFFAGHGVPATEPLTIEVTQRLPAAAGATAAGC